MVSSENEIEFIYTRNKKKLRTLMQLKSPWMHGENQSRDNENDDEEEKNIQRSRISIQFIFIRCRELCARITVNVCVWSCRCFRCVLEHFFFAPFAAPCRWRTEKESWMFFYVRKKALKNTFSSGAVSKLQLKQILALAYENDSRIEKDEHYRFVLCATFSPMPFPSHSLHFFLCSFFRWCQRTCLDTYF